jgi:probable F420-dependent oxidoreductase
MLAAIAATTRRIRLGTNVYNIGLRHPFVTARAVTTLDVISGGRFTFGIGASWLEEEWRAAGLDFATRGARVDETIAICRRLRTERNVAHAGDFFRFEPVWFEPKPVQSPIPIHVGGDSARAVRRAAELGEGWIGMIQTPTTFAATVARLRARCEAAGRDPDCVEATALAPRPDEAALAAWRAAGADRLIVAPWHGSADALDGLARFAEGVGVERANIESKEHLEQGDS